jgi:hypothetical protein
MKKIAELTVPLSLDIVHLVTGAVDQAALVFGFQDEERDRCILGVEEVFVYLASKEGRETDITVRILDGGYYLQVTLVFPPISFPVQVLNITAVNDPQNQSSFADVGIFIAARITDRFLLNQDNVKETIVHLIFEKKYPEFMETLEPPTLDTVPELFLVSPGTNEEIKQAAARVFSTYTSHAPDFFRFPGKVVDMVRSGEYRMVLASDRKGCVFGCLLWRKGKNLIEAFGPFLFISHRTLGEDLVRYTLESLGRSGAVCMIIRDPTPQAPMSWFEELPCLMDFYIRDTWIFSCMKEWRAPLYRQLEEDTGAVVIVHPDLTPAVRTWYDIMALPRTVISASPAGEQPGDYSSFTVKIDKNSGKAVISSRTIGKDASVVLSAHLALLLDQGYSDISYEMDMSDENEPYIYPGLINAGFRPIYILPWGDHGDICIFFYLEREQR